MKVEFTSKVLKDFASILDKDLKLRVAEAIEQLEFADTLKEVPNLKQMKGAKNAYRLKIGYYRLGFILVDETIFLSRFAHRKAIYRFFP